jgi:tetratricopeptide (TPR) repeat protein
MEAMTSEKVKTCLSLAEEASAAGDLTEVISQISAAIFLRPDDAQLYARRASACLDVCDFSTAVANMTKAVLLTGRRDVGLVHRLAHVLDARGLTLLDEGDLKSAITAFNEAITLVERTAPARKQQPSRAELEADQTERGGSGEPDEAAQAPRRPLSAHTQAIQSFRLHRALALIGLGNTNAAAQDLYALTEAMDASADAHCLLARVQLKTGHLFDARKNLTLALQAEPDHAQAKSIEQLMSRSTQVRFTQHPRACLVCCRNCSVPRACLVCSSDHLRVARCSECKRVTLNVRSASARALAIQSGCGHGPRLLRDQ